MRATDFLNQSMVEDIMGDMHPDSSSIAVSYTHLTLPTILLV